MRAALSRRAFVAAAALGPVVGEIVARAPAADAGSAPQVEVLVIRHTWSSALRQRLAGFRGPSGETAVVTESDISPGMLLSQGHARADVVMYRTLDEEDLLLSSGVLRPEVAADMGADPQAPALVAAAAETSRLGSPVTTGGPALFAHASMLDELGDPRLETFDDLYAAAYQLNAPGSRVGIVVSDEMTVVGPVLYSFGGAVAEYGTPTLGSAGSEAMYAYVGQLLRDCGAGRDSLLRPDDAIGAFASGGAALLLGQSELELAVRSRTRPDLVDGVRRLPVPAGPDGRVGSTLPGWSLGVSRQANDPAAAEAFIRWAIADPAAAFETAGTEPAAPLLSLATGSVLTDVPVGVDPRRAANDDMALVTNESAHAVRAPLAASAAGLDVAASQEKSSQVIETLLGSP